jgi:DNA-binding MarR family transcriptional regulator
LASLERRAGADEGDQMWHRRTKLVALTPRGREVLGQIYQRQLAWFGAVTSRLSEATLRDLTTALNQVSHVLAAEISTDDTTT